MLNELEQGMRHLQEKVKDLAGGGVFAVDMFQFESPVLLDVEAFILDFPAESPSFIRECRDAFGRHREIGHPLEARGLGLTVWVWSGFEALQDRNCMLPSLRVHIGDLVDTTKVLLDSRVRRRGGAAKRAKGIFGGTGKQGV